MAWATVVWAQDLPQVTLEQAVEAAGGVAPVRAALAGVDAATARVEQSKAARLPALGVSASVNLWDQAQEVSFLGDGPAMDCTTLPDPFLAGLCAGLGEPLVVRNQVTGSLSAHTALPLTGQWAASRRILAAESGLGAAEAAVDAARADARYQAEDAFFLALSAEGQREIAEAQVQSLRSRVEAAAVAFEGGTVTRNDVLKAELALARAEQQVITTRVLRDAARTRLGLAIGNGGEPVVPVGAPTDPPAPDARPVEALVQLALANRPELAAARRQLDGTTHQISAQAADRYPSVALVGTYVHTEGQGAFALPNAAFVGASLEWAAWDWGARGAAVDAARAGQAQLRAQLDAAEAGVRAEVRGRADALAAAVEAWAVAARSIDQATENLRIQDTLRGAGSGTMTDLLDAEAAVVEARSRTAAASYDAHRAAAALRRALGEGA